MNVRKSGRELFFSLSFRYSKLYAIKILLNLLFELIKSTADNDFVAVGLQAWDNLLLVVRQPASLAVLHLDVQTGIPAARDRNMQVGTARNDTLCVHKACRGLCSVPTIGYGVAQGFRIGITKPTDTSDLQVVLRTCSLAAIGLVPHRTQLLYGDVVTTHTQNNVGSLVG